MESTRITLTVALVTMCTSAARAQCPAWTHLSPEDPGLDVRFGRSAAIGDGFAVVGAFVDDDLGVHSGSAYVFDTSTGAQRFKLLASDGAAGDYFGSSVATHGGTVLVGAPGSDLGFGIGKAYLFDAATGQELRILEPSPAGIQSDFGRSVAIDAGIAVVGAPFWPPNVRGAAFVFDLAAGSTQMLVAPDGVAQDRFGAAVAVSGTTVVVSAPLDDNEIGTNAGAVWVFDLAAGTEYRILPRAHLVGDLFGNALALSGSTLLVGTPSTDLAGTSSGSAYLHDTTSGLELAELVASDARPGAFFGSSVAIHAGRALIGAFREKSIGSFAGAAYVFDVPAGREIAKLLPDDGAIDDTFGYSVGIHGTVGVVGAQGDDEPLLNSGSAYLVDVGNVVGRPYCFGLDSAAPCPCTNTGAPTHGCANGTFAEGAHLCGTGSPAVTLDDLVLGVSFSTPGQPGVFVQGDEAAGGNGVGTPFGDGLRCVQKNVLLLEFAVPDASGALGSTITIAASGGVAAGDVKRYQWWYRDPLTTPCGNGFNLSNGLEVIWAP